MNFSTFAIAPIANTLRARRRMFAVKRWAIASSHAGIDMKKFCCLIPESLFCFALIVSAVPCIGQRMALQDGDRVAFYGDSITAQRYYTRFVEDFVLTRAPGLHVTFTNAGIPGDTVYGGYTGDTPTRLKRDLFPIRPTVVTVMLGMNDGYYMPFEQKYLDNYESGYRTLLAAIQSGLRGVRITLLSPTPYDEITHGTEFPHYSEVVARHAAFVKELASSSGYHFSDFQQTIARLMLAGARKDPALAALLIPDRIHPAEASQWAMAAALVRDWGFSPIISRAHIDALKAGPITTENTQITEISFSNGRLQWKQLDGALPLPLNLEDGQLRFVLDCSDVAAMDQQILRVDNLPQARYTLIIDGKSVADFDREQFSAGVNLALYPTPMLSQAGQVDDLEKKRAQLDEAYFILAVEPPTISEPAIAAHLLAEKNAALLDQQRKLVKPVVHSFELDPD